MDGIDHYDKILQYEIGLFISYIIYGNDGVSL